MLLIIGYGNPLRRDDGAGLVLAEQLEALCRTRQLPVERITVHQLTPELTLDIARPEVAGVVFVDTCLADPTDPAPAIELSLVTADSASPSIGHHLDPAALLIYAALLYNRRPLAWRLTIPGFDLDHGEGFSPLTAGLLAKATPVVVGILGEVSEKIA